MSIPGSNGPLKAAEGKTLTLAFYEKESDQWVLVFDGGKKVFLVDSVEEVSEPKDLFERTLVNELPYALDMIKLQELCEPKKEEPQKEEPNETTGTN